MSVRDEGQEVLPEPTMTMTLEETSLWTDEHARHMFVEGIDQEIGELGEMTRQIEGMHLELHETGTNDTTHKQHNIFMQKDIRREIKKSCDSPKV